MTEKRTATLTTYITDMHALVNHGLQAFDRIHQNLKGERHPEALAAMSDAQQTLRGQLTQLDARAQALGGKMTQPIKDAVMAVTGFAAGLIAAVRPEEASKAIRDSYTYLSHVAIGYLMLYTTASSLGDNETTIVAEQGYRDAARLVILIDRIMPTLVIQDLREDGLPMTEVSDRVQAMVIQAWRREASGMDSGSNSGSAS